MAKLLPWEYDRRRADKLINNLLEKALKDKQILEELNNLH
mgnify:FL=1